MAKIAEKPERPIEGKVDDFLGRGDFVDRLSKSLVTPSGQSTGAVIGLTGSWGSGKSSILNLLREHLRLQYPDAILIVNFDPWLISGRDDLITQFLAQVIGTINSEPKLRDKLKDISKALAAYGSQLSPIVNLIKPGLGAVFKGGFTLVERALSGSKNLVQLRKELETELQQLGMPIVVMIDELDRVEDEEVRAVAQLVRAVADFRSISYVLAFDAERVTDALGGDGDKAERMERGKAYLEKIVQLQIPVPITLEEEILRLLESSLLPILSELGVPEGALANPRYREVAATLIGGIITTPRDVRRLVGTYHAVAGMVFGEVDWIDALVYCTLLVKAAASIELLKRNFQIIVQGQISETSAIKRMTLERGELNQRLKFIMQDASDENLAHLLALVFPFASEKPDDSFDHQDLICMRRPLLTMLRLGLPPSTVSRKKIESIIRQPPADLETSLRTAYKEENFDDFYDRFSTIYLSTDDLDELPFWIVISNFVKKPDLVWIDHYNPMYEVVRNFAGLFEAKVTRRPKFVKDAKIILQEFIEINEKELMPAWLRSHVFAHRLFGNSAGAGNPHILSASETMQVVSSLNKTWRDEHLSGKLLQSRWGLEPVYTMIDSGGWDADCKGLLAGWMSDDAIVDAVVLRLFGSYFSTGRDTVEAFCGWDNLIKRAKERLSSSNEMHESVRVALKKAVGERR